MDESIANVDNSKNQAKEADPLWSEAGTYLSELTFVIVTFDSFIHFSCFYWPLVFWKKNCVYKNDLFLQVLIRSLQFPARLVFPERVMGLFTMVLETNLKNFIF